MQPFILRAPAKINLFFEILNKRNDGYHNVCSICARISLFDDLTISCPENIDTGIMLKVTSPQDTYFEPIPVDNSNIIFKAITEIKKRCHINKGCIIELVKRIPPQAGMGGGSSDAATAILLANQLWELNLTTDEMIDIGATLGSDVPLFFIEGFSLGQGRGEIVEQIVSDTVLHFVVVKPPTGISTATAFRQSVASCLQTPRSPELLLAGLRENDLEKIGAGLFNRLEKTSELLCPIIGTIRKTFDNLDCVAHQMTGSGSAYYGLCRDQAHAERMALTLKELIPGEIFVLQTLKDY